MPPLTASSVAPPARLRASTRYRVSPGFATSARPGSTWTSWPELGVQRRGQARRRRGAPRSRRRRRSRRQRPQIRGSIPAAPQRNATRAPPTCRRRHRAPAIRRAPGTRRAARRPSPSRVAPGRAHPRAACRTSRRPGPSRSPGACRPTTSGITRNRIGCTTPAARAMPSSRTSSSASSTMTQPMTLADGERQLLVGLGVAVQEQADSPGRRRAGRQGPRRRRRTADRVPPRARCEAPPRTSSP